MTSKKSTRRDSENIFINISKIQQKHATLWGLYMNMLQIKCLFSYKLAAE